MHKVAERRLRQLVIAITVCFLQLQLMAPADAQSYEATLFVMDFPAANDGNRTDGYVELIVRASRGEAKYGVIDPRGPTFMIDGLGSRAERGQDLERRLTQFNVRLRSKGDVGYDLAETSELISRLILANPAVNAWTVYFLGSVRHEGDEFVFQDGYPNDGFIFLDDSEFGYVYRLEDAAKPGVDVHVFYAGDLEFENEYDRFIESWTNELWGAELKSFNDGMDHGTRPAYDPSALTAVERSAIVRRPVNPLCDQIDVTSMRELGYALLEFSVSNPCRRGAVVVLRVDGVEYSGLADAEGNALVDVGLNVGLNSVELRAAEGDEWTVIHRHEVGDVTDAIETVVVDGRVTLNGFHPMREDATMVRIRHDGLGRTWEVPVLDRSWTTPNIALAAGLNEFRVLQLDGETEIPVYVQNSTECNHSRRVSSDRGLAIIQFTDLCLAGETLELDYRGRTFAVQFDSAGQAEIKIALEERVNRITYDLRGVDRLIEIPVSGVSELLRITLSWDATIDLDLHILEDEEVRVFHGNLAGTYGSLDFDNLGRTQGEKQESYSVNLSDLQATGGSLKFDVVNYSRRNRSGAQVSVDCDGGSLETVLFRVTVVERGSVRTIEDSFEPFPCDASTSEIREASTIEVFDYDTN